MKNVIIYCEGQTEESFVNTILSPYFSSMDIYVTPIIHKTKRTPTKSYKGGVSDYETIKNELLKICQNPNFFVTTMFDYYGMPSNTPSIDYMGTDLYNRIEHIECEITKDIGCSNLAFNLLVHEFESLLFSDTQAFSAIANVRAIEKLQAMRSEAESPEYINNSVDTAPSKRIKSVISDYSKVRQGIIVAKKIGIDKMISECRHFANWISVIKAL